MAFYVGSFAGGLFNGAQSAMSLYTGYQQLSSAMDASDALDKVKAGDAMAKANANIPGGWNRDTNAPYGTYEQAGAQGTSPIGAPTQSSTEGPVPQGSGIGPAPTTPTAPVVPVKATPLAPSGDGGGGGEGVGGKTPPSTTGAGGPGGDIESARRKDLDAYHNKNPTVTPPPVVPQVNPLASATANPDLGSNIGTPVPPPQPAGPVARVPMPPQPPPFNAAGVQGPPGSPSGAPAYRPDQNPVSQAVTGIGNVVGGASSGFTAPPPAPYTPPPPSNTQGVGGYFGAFGPQSPQIPAGQGTPPVIPPPQPPASPPPPTAQPAANVPLAQNQPPSAPTLGSKIGSVISSVGQAIIPSAQAAETPPAPAAPQGVTPPAPAPTPTPTPAPAPAPTPATPPKTAPAPAVAPVSVSGGAGGKVAPGQTQPSQQSEPTPLAMAPQVDPSAWGRVQKENPQLAQQIKAAVDQYGGGAVTTEQVAAHMQRESQFNVNVGTGPNGEHGVMQVMPETQTSMEQLIGHKVDQNSVDGSLALGVTYLRYLAKDMGLGANTIQTNFAYMRGPGAVNFVNRNGLDAANKIPSLQHALGWTEDMYGGQVKLTQAVFTGGNSAANHVGYTGQGAQAAAQQGPDGVLRYVSTMGPQGLGMSERWSQLQTALERQAIWSGHPEALGHITDWVAQQSHMGAMSNLAAADNALSQGNGALAAQFVAKAHAFFPDGTYMRAGVDNKGQLWGEQFNEGSGQSMGKPIMITQDALRQQMLILQNPNNYVQALQKYQLENAQIDQVKAHTDYYRAMPQERADAAADRARVQEDAIQQRRDAADQRTETQRQTQAVKAGNQQADERQVRSEVGADYKDGPQPGEVPETLGRQSQVDAILRRNDASGGASMAGPMARETAGDLVNGRGAKLDRQTDKNGVTRDAVIGKDGSIRGYLATDQGDRIRGLAGTQKPAAVTGGTQHTMNTGVGAGMNSPMVAMGGMNMNLAGVPTQPMPQPQQAIG